jgi:poly(hydroxyalkanoate) depolymerase family esterase
MRKLLFFSILSVFFTWAAFGESGSMTIAGKSRTYIVHVPSGLAANPPLVLNLHGMSSNASQEEQLSGMDKVADQGKFIVVYPNSDGSTWDLTATGNDVKYVVALIDTMIKLYNVDPKKVFETGFSMGGMMSYALECSVPDKFAAFGPNSGYLMGGTSGCSNAPPKPIFHIHGAADTFVKYSDLQAFLNFFINKWHCPNKQTTTNYNGNSNLTKDYWGPCDQGSEVTLISVAGMQHEIKNGTDFSEAQEVWNYFKKYADATGIASPISGKQAGQSISAVYNTGSIHLKCDQNISLVRVFDIQGKAIALWKNTAGAVHDISLPTNCSSGGIYLLKVIGSTGATNMKFVIP